MRRPVPRCATWMEPFLKQMKAIDDLVKSFIELDTSK